MEEHEHGNESRESISLLLLLLLLHVHQTCGSTWGMVFGWTIKNPLRREAGFRQGQQVMARQGSEMETAAGRAREKRNLGNSSRIRRT